MKKFIFGVMLLVSLLGIVGCSMNPSDSDGSENDTYIVKNSTGSEMTISYKNKSGEWANEKTIPVDGTYEIPANDAEKGTDAFGDTVVPVKIQGDTKEYRMISETWLREGVQIKPFSSENGYSFGPLNAN